MALRSLSVALAMATLVVSIDAHAAQAEPKTGDIRLSYLLPEAGETIPYRVYVPSTYDGTQAFPLVVVLHGGGQSADKVMETPGLREMAEEKGVILLAPQGYSPFGSYGDIYPVVVSRWHADQVSKLKEMARPGQAPAAMPKRPADEDKPALPEDGVDVPVVGLVDPVASQLSQLDTMNVIKRVRGEFRIDPSRIYLMGNSMGGLGTAYLAARYPEVWAAIAPSGGPFSAWSYPYFQLREHRIPALFVHGELDEHAHWTWSQKIVDRAKAEGVDATLRVVEGGNHSLGWSRILGETFDFLLTHRNDRPAPENPE
jgi:poly(3-hydroxybutyrate) depolymerase